MWPYLQLKNNDCLSLVLVLKYTRCFLKEKRQLSLSLLNITQALLPPPLPIFFFYSSDPLLRTTMNPHGKTHGAVLFSGECGEMWADWRVVLFSGDIEHHREKSSNEPLRFWSYCCKTTCQRYGLRSLIRGWFLLIWQNAPSERVRLCEWNGDDCCWCWFFTNWSGITGKVRWSWRSWLWRQ